MKAAWLVAAGRAPEGSACSVSGNLGQTPHPAQDRFTGQEHTRRPLAPVAACLSLSSAVPTASARRRSPAQPRRNLIQILRFTAAQ